MRNGNDICCTTHCVHEDAVERAAQGMAAEDEAMTAADFFKVLGDATRVKILSALAAEPELCVCDIAALTGMSESAVSHQLRVLRNTRVARTRKQGRIVYYSLADQHVADILKLGLEHAAERFPAAVG